jgi:hypothetical protein
MSDGKRSALTFRELIDVLFIDECFSDEASKSADVIKSSEKGDGNI